MNAKGFTLIEMVVVLVIVATVLGLAVSGMSNYISNARIRSAAEELLGAVNLSRSEAIKRNDTVKLDVTSGGGWTVSVYSGTGYTVFKSKGNSSGLLVTSTLLKFDGTGEADKAFVFEVKPANNSCAGVTCLNIQVNEFGKAKLCNPAAASTEVISCT